MSDTGKTEYNFEIIDESGELRSGTVNASSQLEAMQALNERGWRIRMIEQVNSTESLEPVKSTLAKETISASNKGATAPRLRRIAHQPSGGGETDFSGCFMGCLSGAIKLFLPGFLVCVLIYVFFGNPFATYSRKEIEQAQRERAEYLEKNTAQESLEIDKSAANAWFGKNAGNVIEIKYGNGKYTIKYARKDGIVRYTTFSDIPAEYK